MRTAILLAIVLAFSVLGLVAFVLIAEDSRE